MKEILKRIEKIEEFLGMAKPKEQAVLRTIKRISGKKKEIPVAEIFRAQKNFRLDVEDALISLKKQGEIFEPRTGFIQLI